MRHAKAADGGDAKTLIMTHGDCDGICAGAICLSAFPRARMFFTKPNSFVRDMEDVLSEDDFSRVVICDIAINKSEAMGVVSKLGELRGSAEVMYFDHHILPDSISSKDVENLVDVFVNSRDASASELAYRHFQDRIPGERVWIALYGAIGDYSEDTPFATERLKNWDRRALYFEVSTLVLGIKGERFSNYDAKRRIARILAAGKNPSDIPGLVKEAKRAVAREFELYEAVKKNVRSAGRIGYTVNVPSYGFRGPAALFAATTADRPVGMCFIKRSRNIDVTIRGRDERIRLNRVAEEAAEAVGGTGGGHEVAAGARIPFGRVDAFLKEANVVIETFLGGMQPRPRNKDWHGI